MKKALQTIRHSMAATSGIVFLLLGVGMFNANAQLSGVKNVPGNYPTLAAAITDLNAQGVGPGGVTINMIGGNPETAPAGGYIIGGVGSAILTGTTASTATNPVMIIGNANVIKASTAQAIGSASDALFKIVGADWITIQDFILQENLLNTSTTVSTNNMTEFGIALFYVSATDGAKNNTIKNNTLSLSPNYQNTIAIYSSTIHNATVITTAANATATSGLNTGLKIYGNTIASTAYGIYVVSPPNTTAITESGLDIGGNTPATGNTITFGLNTAADAGWSGFFAGVAGISYRNGIDATIQNNKVTSYSLATPFTGISFSVATNPAGVTYTNTINNNRVTLTQTSNNTTTGIDFGYGVSTGTIIGSGNKVIMNHPITVTASSTITGIKANYASATNTCNNDTVTINQTFSPATALTHSGNMVGMTLFGTSAATTANANIITINQVNSPSAAITSTLSSLAIGLSISGLGSTVNALNNQILIARSTSAGAGKTAILSGIITGIQSAVASTLLNIGSNGNGNIITIKEDTLVAGGTSTYSSIINYVDIAAAHLNSNVVDNIFNTTGSQIFSTGQLTCITVGSSKIGALDNRKGNTAVINRVAASGLSYFSYTNAGPTEPADTISNNSITFTGLRGSSSATAIASLGGSVIAGGTFKNINNNTISITGTNTGLTNGITSPNSSGNVLNNSITINSASSGTIGINLTSNSFEYNVARNTLDLTSSSTATPVVTGISGSGAGPYLVYNNILANLSSNAGGAAVPTITGITVSTGTDHNIYANIFTNLTTSGTGATGNITVTAISVTGGNVTNVDSNQISNISTGTGSGNGTVTGISISAGTVNNVYKNNIYNLSSSCTGTATLISGVRLSGGITNNVYNNLVSQTNTLAGVNSVDAIRGINVSSTTANSTNNVYYNSVYLNASSSGADFGTTGVYHVASAAATTATLNLRNNIIVNVTTATGAGLTVAFRRSTGVANSLANYGATSNNNNLYAGTPGVTSLIYSDGTASAQTIASYKSGVFVAGTIASRDMFSFSENPTFKSINPTASNFLRIDTLVPTQIESGAANIAMFTSDFRGSIRAGNPGYGTQVNGGGSDPDIGAWEFDGLPSAPVISAITVPVVTCVATAHTVSATIIPKLGTVTGATINYAYNGVAQTPVAMTTSGGSIWQGNIPAAVPANASVTFSITATNSAGIASVKLGTGYKDAPLLGYAATVSSNNPVCLGTSTTMKGIVKIAGNIAIGDGVSTSATSPDPFFSNWSNTHNQYLIRASELIAAQLAPGNITALSLEITSGTMAMADFSIKVANTVASDVSVFVSPTFTTFTTVYSAATVTPVIGVNTLTFSTPFVWDGVSNIVIEICHGNAVSSATMASTAVVDNTSYISTIHTHKNAASAGTATCGDVTSNLATFTIRPKFTFAGSQVLAMNSYSWSEGTTTIGSANPISVAPVTTTNYTLTATDQYGCSISNAATPHTLNVISTTLGGVYTVGSSGTYPSIISALDAYAKVCTITGPVVFELLDSTYSTATGEIFPIVVRGNAQASATKTLTIRPAAGVKSTIIGKGVSIFSLDSAKFLILDGRRGGTGTPKSLIVQNDSTLGGAIRFINDAKYNTIRYADLRGASTDPTIGVVNFNTGLVTGNDSNSIDNCDIRDGISTPASLVQSLGSTATSTLYNDYNTISNCNLYNFWNAGGEGNAFKISNGNNNWTITGNSVYQTTPKSGTTGYYIFNFQHGGNFAALNGMMVTNNYIGGTAPFCGGTPWTQTSSAANQNTYFNMGNVAKSKFSNNTMANYNFTTTSTSASGAGVFNMVQYINGMLDIDSNTFGSMTDSNSIAVAAGNGGALIPISVAASNTAGTYSITGNRIGGVSVNGGLSSNSIIGINITTAGNTITYNIDNNTIGNAIPGNIIAGPSNGSGIQFVAGVLNASTANVRIRNNTIRNLTNLYYGTFATTSVTIGSSSTNGINSSAGILTITGNQIYALANGGGGQSNVDAGAAVNGISLTQSTAGNLISQNKIYGLYHTNQFAGTVNLNGINISGITTSTVSKNFIHSLTTVAPGNTSVITGINYVSGSSSLVNNMIRLGLDTNGSSITTAPAIRGINKKAGNMSAYFNSVYIGGAGVGSGTSNTYAFSRTTAGTDDLRNNIFMNKRSNALTAGGGTHFAFGTNNATTFNADNNLYFVDTTGNGDTLAQFGTTPYTSLAIWKNTVGLDANSISGNPGFATPSGSNSTVNLHIAGATPVEGAGVPITGITDDYDGDVRSLLTPTDLGADAGNFTLSDISGPAISYTTLSIDTVSTQRMVTGTISITDPSGVNIGTNKPRIYYKKKTDANVFGGNTSANNGWKYVEATNTTSPFNFTINYTLLNGGSIAVGDTILYFVVAQDVFANLGANPGAGFSATAVTTITSAPNSPNQYVIKGNPLRGTYLVGTGKTSPNFTTLTSAITRLNDVGVGAAVVFSLTDASYTGTTETFPLTINQYIGSSAVNTVTIKPAVGNTALISGSMVPAILLLNGADYVTINGSNNAGTSRNLTIENTSTSTGSAVVWGQASSGDSATHNTIANTIINGNAPNTTIVGIGFGSTTISIGSLGVNNNSNTIQNCSVSRVQNGIYFGGTSVLVKDYGNRILDNVLNSVAPNNIGLKGIYVAFQDGIQIVGNTVGNITNTASVMGISLGDNTSNVFAPTGSEVTNALVSRNNVGPILSTGGTSALGIAVVPVASGTNIIQNNMVSQIQSNATPNDFCVGIYVGGGAGSTTKVYFNTVLLSGNTSTRTTPNCYALAIGNGDPAIDVRNNILVNRQTTTGLGNSYAIGFGSSTFANLILNYNNYYVTGANAQLAVTGGIGIAGTGTTYNTLTAFRSATGKDANSADDSTRFISFSDLHLTTGSIGNIVYAGIPVSGITDDIDGQTRNVIKPYMGADENTSYPLPVILTSFKAAVVNDKDVLVSWTTASELNNAGFEVERSVNGKTFEFAGFVKGLGNSNRELTYTLVDAEAFVKTGVNLLYYRLKQLDNNGGYAYSNKVSVSVNTADENGLSVFPNPYNTTYTVSFNATTAATAFIEMTDIQGRLISRQTLPVVKGYNAVAVENVSAVQTGIYLVKITVNGETRIVKLVKN